MLQNYQVKRFFEKIIFNKSKYLVNFLWAYNYYKLQIYDKKIKKTE